jgi:hypothetical protein
MLESCSMLCAPGSIVNRVGCELSLLRCCQGHGVFVCVRWERLSQSERQSVNVHVCALVCVDGSVYLCGFRLCIREMHVRIGSVRKSACNCACVCVREIEEGGC